VARHFDSGVVEITNERRWRTRRATPADGRCAHGRTDGAAREARIHPCQEIANQKHRYVVLIDPSEVIKRLAKEGLVDADWHATYDARRIATKEAAATKAEKKSSKVVLMPGAAEKAK